MTGTKRVVRALVLSIPVLVAVFVGVLAKWILAPSSVNLDEPLDVDAVVVLAGGDGERLATALELMEAEAAPVLIISTGNETWPGRPALQELCDSAQPFAVICRAVDPDTTSGEANELSRLAEQEGWTSLAVVTSTYHLHRATTLFDRCFSGAILAVEAEVGPNRDQVLHEAFGTINAMVRDRHCSDV